MKLNAAKHKLTMVCVFVTYEIHNVIASSSDHNALIK